MEYGMEYGMEDGMENCTIDESQYKLPDTQFEKDINKNKLDVGDFDEEKIFDELECEETNCFNIYNNQFNHRLQNRPIGINPLVKHNLFQAVKNNDLEYIKKNITKENSGYLNIRNGKEYNRTLLHTAVLQQQCKIIQYLVEQGADINLPDKRGDYPLHSFLGDEKNYEIKKFLIKNGANVNVQNDIGVTPLMLAVVHRQTNNINLLLVGGADCTLKDIKGGTVADHVYNFYNSNDYYFDTIFTKCYKRLWDYKYKVAGINGEKRFCSIEEHSSCIQIQKAYNDEQLQIQKAYNDEQLQIQEVYNKKFGIQRTYNEKCQIWTEHEDKQLQIQKKYEDKQLQVWRKYKDKQLQIQKKNQQPQRRNTQEYKKGFGL